MNSIKILSRADKWGPNSSNAVTVVFCASPGRTRGFFEGFFTHSWTGACWKNFQQKLWVNSNVDPLHAYCSSFLYKGRTTEGITWDNMG